jgi:type I restriction enzyme, R subunit
MREIRPSPLWGRGWPATGAFISRGRTGEGVKPVKTPTPYRKTRSLARTAGQIDKAREFRQTPTETEQAAWDLLRGLRSRGFKFRRQHPVGPYIADFCCTEVRLIVELDGGVHGEPRQVRSDARRDAHLKSMGYTLLRLPNGIVLQAPDLFVQKVVGFVLQMEGGISTSGLDPLTRPASADENASSVRPLPQRGEG